MKTQREWKLGFRENFNLDGFSETKIIFREPVRQHHEFKLYHSKSYNVLWALKLSPSIWKSIGKNNLDAVSTNKPILGPSEVNPTMDFSISYVFNKY